VTPVRMLLVGTILVTIVAACGGAAANQSAPPSTDVTVTAEQGSFYAAKLDVPAGRPFDLWFRNLDPAEHNVAIYTDESAVESLFVGEIVTYAATLYHVPALEAGQFYFRCDVHPNMWGTVVAGG
jgi:plastocyanin